MKCEEQTEVYARVCGFFRPVEQWNKGKKSEFVDRKEYSTQIRNERTQKQYTCI